MYIIYINKKSINFFTLNYEYDTFLKNIFNIKNLNELMNYITNSINKSKESESIINRLMEYSWYVFIDNIIINKDKFLKFYENIIIGKGKIDQKIKDKLELIYNQNIKKYETEKNNINYHKIILDSI